MKKQEKFIDYKLSRRIINFLSLPVKWLAVKTTFEMICVVSGEFCSSSSSVIFIALTYRLRLKRQQKIIRWLKLNKN